MKPENAIEVNLITKTFRLYSDKGNTLKERVLFKKRRAYENREVLKGISFEVKKGEAIGLIGQNGCGKSTMLKLLSKIMYPDSGDIQIKGRISSLIELGAGFHPDMSGRQNIYTNASIFGLTKKEIDDKIDTIIEFSELEEYIDNPVRTYSSGMYMRLAFSVAINVDADVLLIDEILAVGDAAFQAKCFNKLREIKSKGVTIIIVSHSLSQIEQFCERTIWIEEGIIKNQGIPHKIHYKYLEYLGKRGDDRKSAVKKEELNKDDGNNNQEDKIAEIISVTLKDDDDNNKKRFITGEKVNLEIKYRADIDKTDEVLIGLLFFRNDRVAAYGTNTQIEGIPFIKLKNKGVINCKFDRFNFISGQYTLDVAIRKRDMMIYDYKESAVTFEMYSPIAEVGVSRNDHLWSFD